MAWSIASAAEALVVTYAAHLWPWPWLIGGAEQPAYSRPPPTFLAWRPPVFAPSGARTPAAFGLRTDASCLSFEKGPARG